MPWNSVASLFVMLPTVRRLMLPRVLPRVLPGMPGVTLAVTLRSPQRRKPTAVAFLRGAR